MVLVIYLDGKIQSPKPYLDRSSCRITTILNSSFSSCKATLFNFLIFRRSLTRASLPLKQCFLSYFNAHGSNDSYSRTAADSLLTSEFIYFNYHRLQTTVYTACYQTMPAVILSVTAMLCNNWKLLYL